MRVRGSTPRFSGIRVRGHGALSGRFSFLILSIPVLLGLSACARTFNYTLPDDPRSSGPAVPAPLPDPDTGIRVVTFNVENAKRIEEAVEVLRETEVLRGADIVFLQEMDAAGAEAIANALSMYWVYYPASINAGSLGEVLEDAGYSWPTRGLGRTAKIFGVDHIFARGFDYAADPPAGVVQDNRGASDHHPVWAVYRRNERDPIPPTPWRFAFPEPTLGIGNAGTMEPTLVRGARPGDEGLAKLKDRGFRTIVNLTSDGHERQTAERLGFDYFEIPLTANLWSSPPREEQVEQFLSLARDPERRPLYFHCRKGRDRTGMMAALYRIEVDRWTNGEAIEEMRAFGYHGWFRDLIQYVRTYVPQRAQSPGPTQTKAAQ